MTYIIGSKAVCITALTAPNFMASSPIFSTYLQALSRFCHKPSLVCHPYQRFATNHRRQWYGEVCRWHLSSRPWSELL